ncbi:MAG TPA: sigma-70 family RNA polymerase sigma factor [Nannocystis exedens]|nr:sigma-70 family RNA polymerase sigma factor [Nannocystis exedens]
MLRWTPDQLKRTLERHDSTTLRELAAELTVAVTAGRAILLAKKPWLRICARDKEDDVQDGLLALFARDASILKKYGDHPSFKPSDGALRRYVIGVTIFVLQRKYQKHRVRWEELREDLAIANSPTTDLPLAGLLKVIDLESAVATCSPADQTLFRLIYVDQREATSISQELQISESAYYARKSRLLQRLRTRLGKPRDASPREHRGA